MLVHVTGQSHCNAIWDDVCPNAQPAARMAHSGEQYPCHACVPSTLQHSVTAGSLRLVVQSGGWASGTPGWLPAARVFLLGSIIFGYFFSATLFLLSARLIGGDKHKLETVMQSGRLHAVGTDFPAWCY